MMDPLTLSTSLLAVLAAASLGGGLYEFSVIDPAWPANPVLIQPANGGVNRKRFWIAIHVAFELVLLVSLVLSWPSADVRGAVLVALASHGTMRLWSAVDFIPKALAFEKADHWTVEATAARAWARRSLGRLPLDLVTVAACLLAFARTL